MVNLWGLDVATWAAIIPSLLLLWFVCTRDRFPEPTPLLLATFGLGVLIVAPVLIIAGLIGPIIAGATEPVFVGLCQAFLQAAIPEELLKYAVVVGVCARWKAFDEPMDGVVYGVVASLGFATLENILYVSQGGLELALLRAVTAVPAHACFGAVMGYFVGQAMWAGQERPKHLWRALWLPVFLHGLYDALIFVAVAMAAQDPSNAPFVENFILVSCGLLVFAMVLWSVRMMARLRAQQSLEVANTGAFAPSAHFSAGLLGTARSGTSALRSVAPVAAASLRQGERSIGTAPRAFPAVPPPAGEHLGDGSQQAVGSSDANLIGTAPAAPLSGEQALAPHPLPWQQVGAAPTPAPLPWQQVGAAPTPPSAPQTWPGGSQVAPPVPADSLTSEMPPDVLPPTHVAQPRPTFTPQAIASTPGPGALAGTLTPVPSALRRRGWQLTVRRVSAWLLEFSLVLGVLSPLAVEYYVRTQGMRPEHLDVAVGLVVLGTYLICREMFTARSWAKALAGLEVVRDRPDEVEPQAPILSARLLRNVPMATPGIPISEALMVGLAARQRHLGDRLAGARVQLTETPAMVFRTILVALVALATLGGVSTLAPAMSEALQSAWGTVPLPSVGDRACQILYEPSVSSTQAGDVRKTLLADEVCAEGREVRGRVRQRADGYELALQVSESLRTKASFRLWFRKLGTRVGREAFDGARVWMQASDASLSPVETMTSFDYHSRGGCAVLAEADTSLTLVTPVLNWAEATVDCQEGAWLFFLERAPDDQLELVVPWGGEWREENVEGVREDLRKIRERFELPESLRGRIIKRSDFSEIAVLPEV